MNDNPDTPQSDIDDLDARINKAKEKKEKRIKQTNSRAQYNSAQAGMEFVLSILVASYGGYLLDGWLDTSPLWLIILFFFGVAAGFTSIFRANKNIGSGIGYSELHQREKQDKTLAKNTDTDSDNLN